MFKRLISFLLTALMLLTMIPIAVSAEGGDAVWYKNSAPGDTSDGTLAQAFAAVGAAPGEYTIRLINDVTLAAKVTLNSASNVTLDLNGNNITGPAGTTIDLKQGTLSITGRGTITDTAAFGAANSMITVYGSTQPSAENFSVLNIGRDVTLSGAFNILVYHTLKCAYGVKINLNGKIETRADRQWGMGITTNGNINKTTGNVPEIVIGESASIVVNSANDPPAGAAIYGAGYANWTINGGSFSGPGSLELKAGKMVINNGRFTATGAAGHIPNNGGGSSFGYSLALIQNNAYSGNIDVKINNGVFDREVTLLDDNKGTNIPKLSITGGTYVNDPSAYLAKGYYASFANGIYTVQQSVQENVTVTPAAPEIKPANTAGIIDTDVKEAVKKATEALTETAPEIAGLGNAGGDAAPSTGEIEEVLADQDALPAALKDKSAEELTVVVQPYLEIEVADAVVVEDGKITSLTLEITPMAKSLITTADNSAGINSENSIEVGAAKRIEVEEPVTISFPLPDNFVVPEEGIAIQHTKLDGRIFYYDAVVIDGMLTFTVTHGFSQFKASPARSASFSYTPDISILPVIYNLTDSDVNQPLPVISNGMKSFDGWRFDGIAGVHKILTDELMNLLVTGRKSATPIWSIKSNYIPLLSSLTFMTNGGEQMERVYGSAGMPVVLSSYVPVREGYIFDGWFADPEMTKPLIAITLFGPTFVYAKWTR